MSEFFKPWRRRLGVIALLLACVGMAGWVRSLSIRDEIKLDIGGQRHLFFYSNMAHLTLVLAIHGRETSGVYPFYFSQPARRLESIWNGTLARWHYSFFGFECGRIEYPEAGTPLIWYPAGGVAQIHLVIPYWSIVLPLTALSAGLLLTKLQRLNESKAANSAPTNGA